MKEPVNTHITPKTDAAQDATFKQRIASDPLSSSWVGASAGSGKTTVLTNRFLRLLLPREDGTPAAAPEKILAITFTKAGANEMALRVSQRLSRWAVMDENALQTDMRDNLFGREPNRTELDAARRLFARVVDTQGGLKIMTIHSFCQSVLGRFPVEAGLPPHFRPLEEEQAAALLAEAQRRILSYAGTDAFSPLGQSVRSLALRMNESDLSSLIRNIVAERHQYENIRRRVFGIDGLYAQLCTLLGLKQGEEEETALAAFAAFDTQRETDLRTACTALLTSTKTDREKGERMAIFLAADHSTRPQFYEQYRRAFLNGTGEPYSKTVTAGLLKTAPHIEPILLAETERVAAFEEKLKSILCASLTRDLFRVADAVLNGYEKIKRTQGALDFDDLIIHTLSLLKGEANTMKGLGEQTAWVLYKMDEGIDHILVDEAQDTNPEQWEIIRLLSNDFFDGLGAREQARTMFVVGDEKQSIFGFQRAAPEKFGAMYDWFENKIRGSGNLFAPVDINTSFRSVQIVLDAVDRVYAQGETRRGVGARYLSHIAQRFGQSGLVELWPILRTEDQTPPASDANIAPAEESGQGWAIPDSIQKTRSGSLKMAIRIGDTIRNWLDTGEKLKARGRAIQAGDIMILVRARNAFVGQLVRELKQRKIPVSGVDRMVLAEQLVVQDLCVAAAFALLPDDDLTLACLLKSPFVGMTEDALFKLTHGRESTLWQNIKLYGDALLINWLESLIVRAGADHPYEFFSRLVQEPCPADSTSAMLAIRRRLGEDALDPLDEFLNRTLAYEVHHEAGLQGFLKWHTDGHSEIKRQMDEAGGMVRIMTIHGAKGLQAPIVFLPDTIRTPAGAKADKILWPQKTGLDVPVCIPSGKDTPADLQSIRTAMEAKADDEYRRLLYVAMTRAEDRLYIGGYYNKRGPSAATAYWYNDIASALSGAEGVQEIESGLLAADGRPAPILRWESEQTATPYERPKHMRITVKTADGLPLWTRTPAPFEPVPPRPLTPSRPSGTQPAAASPRGALDAHRFKRGNATHRLLQTLPDLPPEQRRAAAIKFLARPALALSMDLQADILAETFRLLDDPVFGEIFGLQARAEVSVTGLVNDTTPLSGQIDRLLVREKDILIVDFKTNRPPPQRREDVPVIYTQQMAAYATILRRIYPGKRVRAALLWTDGARLMEVDV